MYFIITMLTNKADGKSFSNTNDKINYFKKGRIPDEHVFRYREIYYND